jgi:hypothetical protein
VTPPVVPEAAVEAAIATSSTWPIRDEDGRRRYRERVEVLLEAALPALREHLLGEVREKLLEDDAVSAGLERLNTPDGDWHDLVAATFDHAFPTQQEVGSDG